jgi:hypothetical protein
VRGSRDAAPSSTDGLMILQETHATSELVFFDLSLGESHLQDISGRGVGRRGAHRNAPVRVVVRLGVVEVTDDHVGDRTDEKQKKKHEYQPRYPEARVGTSAKKPADDATSPGTEGTDVPYLLNSHATSNIAVPQNLPARRRPLGVSFVKNPKNLRVS